MSLAFSDVRLSAIVGVVLGACALTVVACSANAPLPPDDYVGDDSLPSKKPVKNPGTTEVKGADASVPDPMPRACETVLPNKKCGLDPQCGCGANETCEVTVEATGATSCLTAGGATLGRPCTVTGDCIAGLTCEYGACRPYCKTAKSKCGVGGTDLCVSIDDANGKPLPNMNVCTINCDPRVPAGVCGTNACTWYPTLYAPAKVSDCNFAGTIKAFDAHCVTTPDCLPGLACVLHPNKAIGLECEPWCRLGQTPSDCPTGFTCKDVFGADAPVINGVKEGVCQD